MKLNDTLRMTDQVSREVEVREHISRRDKSAAEDSAMLKIKDCSEEYVIQRHTLSAKAKSGYVFK